MKATSNSGGIFEVDFTAPFQRLMSDFEEADFCAQFWRSQKQQRKMKKERVKNKKEQKPEKSRKVQTGERKKKRSRFKEAMMERNEKRRKEKKKKRKKLEGEEHRTAAESNPRQKEKLSPESRILDFIEKSRRTKKVQFASFPPYVRVKRPTFSSSSPKEAEAVRSSQSGPVQERDSPCPSEDINSQDLFITQKSFRTSPRELSSSEATASPLEPHPESNNNRREDPKGSGPQAVHPHLDEPFGMSSFSGRRRSSAESSTQTENFFTSELCSVFSFCQRSRAAEDLNGPKPLDLSLPQRARATLCLTMKASGPSTPSPRFQTDLSFSSEEDHPGRSSRREMIQVKAVQTKLNKPFFFKTKGERLSPRPESPLMKLSQGRAVKSQPHR
ncbi:hypothetical protein OJAV_G00051580 [Oryzias javanicus]|uniref:Uncharacterized protein n=1 Tax=Oryzias javanicus TaxID=123683 RepID=A0A437D9N9_ORYJA|nr:hypothetical protein OJAV_G00051580 [Oryzias javanicus]